MVTAHHFGEGSATRFGEAVRQAEADGGGRRKRPAIQASNSPFTLTRVQEGGGVIKLFNEHEGRRETVRR